MTLSDEDRSRLREIEARLSREDRSLAWRLSSMDPAEEEPPWRPSRGALAILAASLVAAALVIMSVSGAVHPSCPVAVTPSVPGHSAPTGVVRPIADARGVPTPVVRHC